MPKCPLARGAERKEEEFAWNQRLDNYTREFMKEKLLDPVIKTTGIHLGKALPDIKVSNIKIDTDYYEFEGEFPFRTVIKFDKGEIRGHLVVEFEYAEKLFRVTERIGNLRMWGATSFSWTSDAGDLGGLKRKIAEMTGLNPITTPYESPFQSTHGGYYPHNGNAHNHQYCM